MRINTHGLLIILFLTFTHLVYSADLSMSTPMAVVSKHSPMADAFETPVAKDMTAPSDDIYNTPAQNCNIHEADTVLLLKTEARVKDFAAVRKKLTFLHLSTPDRTKDITGKGPLSLRPTGLHGIRGAVRQAQKESGTARNGQWDALANLCLSNEGYGEWALYFAVREDAPEIVRKLLLLRCNPLQLFHRENSRKAEQGKVSPLLRDDQGGDQRSSAEGVQREGKIVKLSQKSISGLPTESLLDIALQDGHVEVAAILIQVIPLWLCNGNGELPFEKAIKEGHGQIIIDLMKAGLPTEQSSHDMLIALQRIARENNAAVLAAFIEEYCAQRVDEKSSIAQLRRVTLGYVEAIGRFVRSIDLSRVFVKTIETLPWLGIGALCTMIAKEGVERELMRALPLAEIYSASTPLDMHY